MSHRKILIASGKCHVALGCRIVYFCHQGKMCPELCSKGDPRGICQADVSRNSIMYTLNMVARKGDLLLNEETPFTGTPLFSYFCLLQKKSESSLNARGNAHFLASLSRAPSSL